MLLFGSLVLHAGIHGVHLYSLGHVLLLKHHVWLLLEHEELLLLEVVLRVEELVTILGETHLHLECLARHHEVLLLAIELLRELVTLLAHVLDIGHPFMMVVLVVSSTILIGLLMVVGIVMVLTVVPTSAVTPVSSSLTTAHLIHISRLTPTPGNPVASSLVMSLVPAIISLVSTPISATKTAYNVASLLGRDHLTLLVGWTHLSTFKTALALLVILEITPTHTHCGELLCLVLTLLGV